MGRRQRRALDLRMAERAMSEFQTFTGPLPVSINSRKSGLSQNNLHSAAATSSQLKGPHTSASTAGSPARAIPHVTSAAHTRSTPDLVHATTGEQLPRFIDSTRISVHDQTPLSAKSHYSISLWMSLKQILICFDDIHRKCHFIGCFHYSKWRVITCNS